jgi:pilus assembly protein Flp/PilA
MTSLPRRCSDVASYGIERFRLRLLRAWCDINNRRREILAEERGATAVEYAIMAVLIAAVIIFVVTAIGEKTNNQFESVNTKFNP